MKNRLFLFTTLALSCFIDFGLFAGTPAKADSNRRTPLNELLAGDLQWRSTGPIVSAQPRPDGPGIAVKDPTVVFAKGRWHIYATDFCAPNQPPSMVYLSFADWKEASQAKQIPIRRVAATHCAPEVFFFRPKQKWYLLYQVFDGKTPGLPGPCVSTLDDIDKPESLSEPHPLFSTMPASVLARKWIDFWIICDDTHAYLFFSNDDGLFYRSRTSLDRFPDGWSDPEVILKKGKLDLFEASCVYRLEGTSKYLAIIECVSHPGTSERYFKSFVADQLDGAWTPVNTSPQHPFAGSANVTFAENVPAWTVHISHGELLRDGYDETLTLDPNHLRFLYQGWNSQDYFPLPPGQKPGYRHIPWQLGLLESITPRHDLPHQ